MAFEKSVYQAPPGLEDLQSLGEPDIEIEIDDPDAVRISADGTDLVVVKDGEDQDTFDANIADEMGEGELDSLAKDLVGDFDSDIAARKDWVDTYVEGLTLLGLKYDDRTEPWDGACGVYHPILSEAVVRFQAETIMETFPASGPVKVNIIGKETPEKVDSAGRVKDNMNYELTERMCEYRPEHERLLWSLPIAGSAFKKVYYDPSLGRQVANFIPVEDMIVPYGAASLESCERVTHVMRKTKNELEALMKSGFYRELEIGEPTAILDDIEEAKAEKEGFEATSDNRHRVLEMHVLLDLTKYDYEKDKGVKKGLALPYVVTVEKGTTKVLGIRRNWYQDDKLCLKRQHFVHYTYVPGFGFYGFGLIHLVGGYAKSATSILRQLVDAGSLANLPGGFKANGFRVKGDDTPIAPGEFRDVDLPSGTIRDNILPLPYKEPSATLYQLLQNIVDEGRRFASAADMKISDMSANAPVGTTLAILERTLKVMSAVQARVHFSMKQEFKLLAGIIRDYTDDSYTYEVADAPRSVKKADYDNVDVIPISDPNAATMSQKVVQFQAVMQMAQGAPQLYNLPLLHRKGLEMMGVKDAAKLIPIPDDMKPKDPVTENMDILMGKPAKAFLYQDHEAHITVHMSAMQDPKIMGMMQNNPNAPAIQAAAMAHLNEHLAYAYRQQIQKQLGIDLPAMDPDNENPLPPEVETELSGLLAGAAQKLLQTHQQEAAAQQAQQQAQDPVIQMQMRELAVSEADLQRKTVKDQKDYEIASGRLELDQKKLEDHKEVSGLQVGARIATDKAQIDSNEKIAGAKIGVDISKAKDYNDTQKELEGLRVGVDVTKHHADQQLQKELQRETLKVNKENKPKPEEGQ